MARETRTSEQIAANQLDLEMFNLANRMERFAAEWASGSDGVDLVGDADALRRARGAVRRLMHPNDRKETEGS